MQTVLTYNESHREHHSAGHVERPDRLDAVMTRLEKNPTWRSLRRIESVPATEEDLRLVHSASMIEAVRDAAREGRHRLDPDTYVTRSSFEVAMDAVGCLLAVTREVLDGRASRGFAAVRPPGHHATPSRSMGFCLFSNVAVAARWAQEIFGIGRVLIVDFDVHHGNGTQEVFYQDPSVLYMSVHQAPFYPGTGGAHERGFGPGETTTINVPLPSGSGDSSFIAVFRDILRPAALGFDPELILISAGYDAHWKDLLGGMRVTTAGFAEIVREILSWAEACCDGRTIGALEGGYHVNALADAVAATVELMSDPDAQVRDAFGTPPGDEVDLTEYLANIRAYFGS